MGLGMGDAAVEQPGVHLLVALEPQTRREEALAHQTDLIFDLPRSPSVLEPMAHRGSPQPAAGVHGSTR